MLLAAGAVIINWLLEGTTMWICIDVLFEFFLYLRYYITTSRCFDSPESKMILAQKI